ncbi:hypothetical protein, no similarity [Maudiozyma barnettii]|uniref:Uncharacterized protein n=1 Tax=Maudiozyma barnettii TaxID=61262 RepID=A0A8H2VFT7_9SACH|nr:hypothetical protein, no similarity [Kazachstania barnettii]CAB4254727.1 hypothetical protein, no similarity [Kazachstania barnettii]CAD1782769.1 hypothetical protein, no similarity [Kazachstania barnettii]
MFSLYEPHNVVKRSHNQFEIEAPSPELPRKRIRYNNTNNSNGSYGKNYNTMINPMDCQDEEFPISPVLSSLSNNQITKTDDGIQCDAVMNNNSNNNNHNHNFNNILTPATTPAANTTNIEWLKIGQQQQQLQYMNNNIGSQLHHDNEIYSEAEEYMVMGYYNGYANNTNNSLSLSSSSTNIQSYNQMVNDNTNENNNKTFHTQYSLYDLTNEEIEMINTQQHRLQDQQMEY